MIASSGRQVCIGEVLMCIMIDVASSKPHFISQWPEQVHGGYENRQHELKMLSKVNIVSLEYNTTS